MVDPSRHFGLDFGTSNSIFASSAPDARVSTFRFDVDGAVSENFPSVLHFQGNARRRQADITAGPWAVQAYLTSGTGRFIQSVKSFVASRAFTTTRIAGQNYRIEDL